MGKYDEDIEKAKYNYGLDEDAAFVAGIEKRMQYLIGDDNQTKANKNIVNVLVGSLKSLIINTSNNQVDKRTYL